MIDGLRRKLTRSIDKDPWGTEQELEPEVDGQETVEPAEPPTDAAVIAAATRVAPSSTNDVDSGEYYKNILKTAIDNGGKYAGHEIPIPWLRMILAGLEWKHIDPEMMWYGFDAIAPREPPIPEMPAYDALFPSEKDAPSWTGIK
jgi:hypothetical protein